MYDWNRNLAAVSAAILLAVSSTAAIAAPGGQGRGSGNSNGYGWYNNNGNGSAAPVPLLAVTLGGQIAGAAGLYLLWRRRRNKE